MPGINHTSKDGNLYFTCVTTLWLAGCGIGAINQPSLKIKDLANKTAFVKWNTATEEQVIEFVNSPEFQSVISNKERAPGIWALVDSNQLATGYNAAFHRAIRSGKCGQVVEAPAVGNTYHVGTEAVSDLKAYLWIPKYAEKWLKNKELVNKVEAVAKPAIPKKVYQRDWRGRFAQKVL